jgi:hypothetical protein
VAYQFHHSGSAKGLTGILFNPPLPGQPVRKEFANEVRKVVQCGSPRLPLIPESLILHHADDLDAKLEMYIRCLTRDQAEGAFTDRDPVLNRQLFKGRSV